MLARTNPARVRDRSADPARATTEDVDIPADLTYRLAEQLCAKGDFVDLRVYEGECRHETRDRRYPTVAAS